MSQVGDGGADLQVALLGRNYDVECKSGDETLSDAQREFYLTWRGPPVVVLHDADEATAWVSSLRRRLFKAHEED